MKTNETRQYMDISQITAESPLITSIISLHRKCGLRHKEGCFAATCEECLARTFNGHYNHLLPIVSNVPVQKSLFENEM